MNKKIILILVMISLVLPLISADNSRPPLDLFYLFVENVFGNMWMAGFGIAGLLAVICIFGRMSNASMIFLVGTFCMVYFMGMLGAIVAVPIFMAAFIYFVSSLLNFISSFR